jgi:membrane dipeptidase
LIIGSQNSRQFEHDYLDGMVEAFYRLGMRTAILAYNGRTFAANGCISGADEGLSREGKALVKEMNRVGMLIDCSHTCEKSNFETIELSEDPCVFTHSNPNSRSDMPRNISDELIKVCAEKGGVIGLTPFPPLNWNGGDDVPTFDDFLDNIEFVIDMVGIDHVGIGTDKEGTPGAYPREIIMREIASMAISVGDYFSKFAGVGGAIKMEGFEELDGFPLITQGLLDRGYDAESIKKVLGGNFMRVFKEVWK